MTIDRDQLFKARVAIGNFQRFEEHSWPDAAELRRRIRDDATMLTEWEAEALRTYIRYWEYVTISECDSCVFREWRDRERFIKGHIKSVIDQLAAEVQSLSDTYGTEAKVVALRFRRVLEAGNGSPGASLEGAIRRSRDFAERSFMGEARPEPVAGETKGEARADAMFKELEKVSKSVDFVACEEQRRKENRERNAKKAAKERKEAEEGAEEKPYDQRMKEAYAMVKRRMAEGKDGGKMLPACRWVCKHYGEKLNQKTGAIIPGGLHKLNGDPMPPETLRDYCRKRRKSK